VGYGGRLITFRWLVHVDDFKMAEFKTAAINRDRAREINPDFVVESLLGAPLAVAHPAQECRHD